MFHFGNPVHRLCRFSIYCLLTPCFLASPLMVSPEPEVLLRMT